MKKSIKKNKVKKEETVDDIIPFWEMTQGWMELPYEKQAEYYWRYEFKDGKRVFGNE